MLLCSYWSNGKIIKLHGKVSGKILYFHLSFLLPSEIPNYICLSLFGQFLNVACYRELFTSKINFQSESLIVLFQLHLGYLTNMSGKFKRKYNLLTINVFRVLFFKKYNGKYCLILITQEGPFVQKNCTDTEGFRLLTVTRRITSQVDRIH